MLIAVIDDGIDFRSYPELKVEYDLVVDENGDIHPRTTDNLILTDHGTTCARIIHTYAPEATFCSLGIFSTGKLRTNIKQLISALDWCYEHKIPLIHLSVGSTRPSDYLSLQKAVFRLLYQRQVLVAAHSNKENRYTMPACFSGVLGVKAAPELTGNSFCAISPVPVDEVRLAASSRHKLVNADGNLEETVVANSYAAPTVTAQVHELLRKIEEAIPFPKIWSRLTGQDQIPVVTLRPDFLAEAIAFDPSRVLEQGPPLPLLENICSTPDKFWDALDANPYAPALILPPIPATEHEFWTNLLERSTNRLGIVYEGNIPSWVRDTAPCLLWDEAVNQEYLCQGSTTIQPISTVPILQIEPYGKEALLFAHRLNCFFAENGIECMVLSDVPHAYLYGAEWVSGGYSIENQTAHICHAFQPDMLLSILSVPFPDIYEKAVLTLVDYSDPVFDSTKNQVAFPRSPSPNDFQKLLAWMT